MNRELKFRAWISNYGEPEMLYFDPIGIQKFDYEDGFVLSFSVDRIKDFFAFENHKRDGSNDKIMQFTGLTDKTGRDVYEGDIVKYYNPYAKQKYTHIVRFEKDFACFALFETTDDKYAKESDWGKIIDVEVIGNVFENPELLDGVSR